jgi:hypothetical protein
VHDFLSQDYKLSSGAAAAAVTEMRPQIEKALTELKPMIPVDLPAPVVRAVEVNKSIAVTSVSADHVLSICKKDASTSDVLNSK